MNAFTDGGKQAFSLKFAFHHVRFLVTAELARTATLGRIRPPRWWTSFEWGFRQAMCFVEVASTFSDSLAASRRTAALVTVDGPEGSPSTGIGNATRHASALKERILFHIANLPSPLLIWRLTRPRQRPLWGTAIGFGNGDIGAIAIKAAPIRWFCRFRSPRGTHAGLPKASR